MSRHCIDCKHFVATGYYGTGSGECRRIAPRALDVNAFSNAKQHQFSLSMGALNGALETGAVQPLYPAQDKASVPLADLAPTALPAAGVNDDEVFPFIIPRFYSLIGITFAASRCNVGTAAVGTNVVVKIVVCQVQGPDTYAETTYDVPLQDSQCHVTGYATDDFQYADFPVINPPTYSHPPLVGAYIDLDHVADNIIGEIRNPFVNLTFGYYSPIQARQFSGISAPTVDFCGKFEKTLGSPRNRCFDCDYFRIEDGLSPAGWCHKHAPRGIDFVSRPGFENTTSPLYQFDHAYISNGKTLDCGDWKPTTRTPYPE